jgi:hypothetical protein
MWMFYGEYADEGNNPVDNPNIYNVEGDNRLSPGLLPLTTGSVWKIRIYNPNIYNVEGDNRLSPGLLPLTTGSVWKSRIFLSWIP